jgi:hypothetical protein
MKYANNNWHYTYKVKNIGLGSPEAPHAPSKDGKVPKFASK